MKQNNLKRLFAYSGISHIGFIIAGLSAINFEALNAAILYAIIYSSFSIGIFALLLLIKSTNKNEDDIYNIDSLSGIGKRNPLISLYLATRS